MGPRGFEQTPAWGAKVARTRKVDVNAVSVIVSEFGVSAHCE